LAAALELDGVGFEDDAATFVDGAAGVDDAAVLDGAGRQAGDGLGGEDDEAVGGEDGVPVGDESGQGRWVIWRSMRREPSNCSAMASPEASATVPPRARMMPSLRTSGASSAA